MLPIGVDGGDVSVGQRRTDIRRFLEERRRELLSDIQSRVRSVREAGASGRHHTMHPAEAVEAEPEDDLPFALIQMKTEMLARVDEAVRHLDDGTYGVCIDCGDAIASSRLRAMPFAVRCRDCEELREDERQRQRVDVQRAPTMLSAGY